MAAQSCAMAGMVSATGSGADNDAPNSGEAAKEPGGQPMFALEARSPHDRALAERGRGIRRPQTAIGTGWRSPRGDEYVKFCRALTCSYCGFMFATQTVDFVGCCGQGRGVQS